MRTLLVFCVLMAIVAGSVSATGGSGTINLSSSGLTSYIGGTIAASGGDQARISFGKCRSATLYGTYNGTSMQVSLYQSIDGSLWRPLIQGVPGDTTYSFSSTAGTKLNVAIPIVAEIKTGTATYTRIAWPLNIPYLKVVVKNTGIAEATGNVWFIQYAE